VPSSAVQDFDRLKTENPSGVNMRELWQAGCRRAQFELQLGHVEDQVNFGLPGQIQLIGDLSHLPDDGERAIEVRSKFEGAAMCHCQLPIELQSEVNLLTEFKRSFRMPEICIFLHSLLSML
jgi:hypothetical protein